MTDPYSRHSAPARHSGQSVPIRHESCWAKTTSDGRPGMSVRDHCLNVGCVAESLISLLPQSVRRILPQGAATVAAIHDVGKVSPGFQKKLAPGELHLRWPEWTDRTGLVDDHTIIGASAAWAYLGASAGPSAAKIILAHHGEEHGSPPPSDDVDTHGGKVWARERRRLLEELVGVFGALPMGKLDFAIQSMLAGLVCVSDWIGSADEAFPPSGLPAGSDPHALARAAVQSCGWFAPRLVPDLSFADVFDGMEPRPIQREFIDAVRGPGLYILEAPTGVGKTEAALYAAYKLMCAGHNQGLYFALPTRLSSDNIHERVGRFLSLICEDGMAARLAHGMAWLREFSHGGTCLRPHGEHVRDRDETLDPPASWFNPLKRALLFPFAVGTIDQALLGVVRVRHYFVRAFGLAGKVVILDEVHSYDVYTSCLIQMLIDQLLATGCTVIVLSATLSGARRRRLLRVPEAPSEEAYPLITAPEGRSIPGTPPRSVEYSVSIRHWDHTAVAEHAVRWAEEGCCVLCIANTVSHAQRWYDSVMSARREGSIPVGLIHSQFPLFRREELESEWLDLLGKTGPRPRGCVLIATQVVEQSVDVDTDCLLTELAPTDMLLQRMGRVWRHDRASRPLAGPEVVMVCGDAASASSTEELVRALGKGSCKVYAPYVLWRTWRVWSRVGRVRVPDDVRRLIEATYAEPVEEEPFVVLPLREELAEARRTLEGMAGASAASVSLPPDHDEEGVLTRHTETPTRDVLLVRGIESRGREARLDLLDGDEPVTVAADRRDFSATTRLHRHLVRVPAPVLRRLDFRQGPPWLAMHFHHPMPVWVQAVDGDALLVDGQDTGYTYDPWHGLRRRETGAQASTPPEAANEDGGDDD